LGLNPGEKFDVIKKRFHELAKKEHPDKCQPPRTKIECEKRYTEISGAFERMQHKFGK